MNNTTQGASTSAEILIDHIVAKDNEEILIYGYVQHGKISVGEQLSCKRRFGKEKKATVIQIKKLNEFQPVNCVWVGNSCVCFTVKGISLDDIKVGDTLIKKEDSYTENSNTSYIEENLEKRGIDQTKLEQAMNSNEEEAMAILNDEEAADKLIDKALKMCRKLANFPIIGDFFAYLPYMCYMVSDYVHGNYKEIPLASIVTCVAAIIYVVSPLDLIPDFIPIAGQIDDAAVVGLALKAIKNDLDSYIVFRESQLE